MPDHGQGRLHHFREHVVAGVNWRPTRFVDEVPSSRICSLCRMIPKRTVLLPCSHALCQSCHAASLEGGVGQCPLDQVKFHEAECFGYEFPTRIANTLKVYCWNEQHGCEYTGTMDRVLEHYENECTFHTVECLRCGEGVQHRDLPTHYAAGCSAGVSSTITECPSTEPTALSLEAVNAALGDLKATLGAANHDQLLPVIQSRLNELTEQVRSQETRFSGIIREIGASERNLTGDMAEIAATTSSTVSHHMTFLRSAAEEASLSPSLSLRSEMALILRKLERLADLEHWQQTSLEPVSSRVIAHCSIFCGGHRHLTSALSTTWMEKIGNVMYDLTLENCEEIIKYQGSRKKFAEIRVWHMRDAYFTVAVFKCRDNPALTVEIEFNGMLVDSRCWPPFWHVGVWDNVIQEHFSLPSRVIPCFCHHYDDSLLHFHLEFGVGTACLKNDGFFRDGKILFQICLADTAMEDGVKGAP
ncbi:uncharacterized protein [Dermacentor andersoni]|uniref:uncharacterized protein n=1 Tax=Dermacentor andersoni TaxID=34620 RepID=UPI002417CBCE|nr:uncharacterized protein LOC129381159 [Dermacentor andersoni]